MLEFLADIWAMFFGSDKPTPANIRRAVKAAVEPHGDAAPRMNAAQRLASWGTPESIRGLLKRFTIQTPSGAVDQAEKQEVCDLLVGLGAAAVDPLFEYLQTGEEATYPAQALSKILSQDELVARVATTLERLHGTFTRTPKGKMALIDVLTLVEDARVPPVVRPYLEDPDDDVVVAAITCLSKPAYEKEVREAFLELVVSCEGRPRIRNRVLEALAEMAWVVTGFRRKLEDLLPEGFVVTGKGLVKMAGMV